MADEIDRIASEIDQLAPSVTPVAGPQRHAERTQDLTDRLRAAAEQTRSASPPQTSPDLLDVTGCGSAAFAGTRGGAAEAAVSAVESCAIQDAISRSSMNPEKEEGERVEVKKTEGAVEAKPESKTEEEEATPANDMALTAVESAEQSAPGPVACGVGIPSGVDLLLEDEPHESEEMEPHKSKTPHQTEEGSPSAPQDELGVEKPAPGPWSPDGSEVPAVHFATRVGGTWREAKGWLKRRAARLEGQKENPLAPPSALHGSSHRSAASPRGSLAGYIVPTTAELEAGMECPCSVHWGWVWGSRLRALIPCVRAGQRGRA